MAAIVILVVWTFGCTTLTRQEWTAIQDECRETVRAAAGPLDDKPFEYDLCVKRETREKEQSLEDAAGRR